MYQLMKRSIQKSIGLYIIRLRLVTLPLAVSLFLIISNASYLFPIAILNDKDLVMLRSTFWEPVGPNLMFFNKVLTKDDLFTAFLAIAFLVVKFWTHRNDPFYHIWFERPQLLNGQIKPIKESRERDVSKKLDQTKSKLLVCWSSQSGTAESYALKLGPEISRKFNLTILLADVSDYAPESFALIPKDIPVVFLMSTYGEGDPPDSGSQFMCWLETVKPGDFQNCSYVAIGFGNSDYKYFNRVADRLEHHMEVAGATPFFSLLRLDAASRNAHESFLDWKESFFVTLQSLLGLQEQEIELETRFSVKELGKDHLVAPISDQMQTHSREAEKCAWLPFSRNVQIMKSERQSYLHVEFNLPSSSVMTYRTGDHLVLWPINLDADVATFLQLVGMQSNRHVPLEFRPVHDLEAGRSAFTTTAEQLLRCHLDIKAPLSRDSIGILKRFAPTADAACRIRQLAASKESFTELGQVSLDQLLQHVDSENPWSLPITVLLDVLPPMKPRLYSISSSSVQQSRKVTILVSVKEDALGTATRFLSSRFLGPSKIIPGHLNGAMIGVKSSKFKLPLANSVPMVLICNGTGLAPFRAFIMERARIHSLGKISGPILLFVGCRRSQDLLYRDDLYSLTSVLGPSFTVHTTFSRDGDNSRYVQDSVREYKKEVLHLLRHENAGLYLCGSAAMARSVGDVISEAMMEKGTCTLEQWTAFKEEKRTQMKWLEDVW